MKLLPTLATLAATLAIVNPAHAKQLVVNGDFTELSNGLGQIGYNTVATGWTTTGYNRVMAVANLGSTGNYGGLTLWDETNGGVNSWNGQSLTGDNFVALDGDYQTAALTQTIGGLTPGKVYQLTFDYAFAQQVGYTGDTIQHITASFGNTSYTTPDYALPSQGFSGWTTYTDDFTANGTSDVLSFLAYGNAQLPPFALLTDVSLTAVPEPSTWAMMLVGLGGLGVLARSRRALAFA